MHHRPNGQEPRLSQLLIMSLIAFLLFQCARHSVVQGTTDRGGNGEKSAEQAVSGKARKPGLRKVLYPDRLFVI